MAYDFDGTNDNIEYNNVQDWNAGVAYTMCGWFSFDTENNDALWSDTAGAADCIRVTLQGTSGAYFIGVKHNASTTDMEADTNANVVTLGTHWHHVAITIDGTENGSGLFIYIDGVDQTDNATRVDMAGTPVSNTGVLQLMGREDLSNRDQDGRCAEIGRWNRVLTAGEVAGLAKGFAPSCYPNGLVEYKPLIRDTKDVITGDAGTIVGDTAVTVHPRIIYPSRRGIFVPAAVGGGLSIPIAMHHYKQLMGTN